MRGDPDAWRGSGPSPGRPTRAWHRLLPARLRRGAVRAEVDTELAFHLEMRAQEFMERGLTAEAARAEALRRMGDLERVRGVCRSLGEARERDMQRAEWFTEVGQDVRFGVRQLWRTRGLTLVALLTLALGIGATAAIFGVVDAVVLRPLPFDAPERVVQLRSLERGEPSSASAANFLDWRAQGTASGASFEAMAAWVETGLTVTGGDLPVLLDGARVSADYFAVFGVRPLHGRTFLPEEDVAGRGRVAVLSARAWAKHFRSDPRVLGQTIQLSGTPYTLVGIMPSSFDFREGSTEVWVPLAWTPEERASRGASYLTVVGRLRRDATVERAQREMDAVARRLEKQYPGENRQAGIRVRQFAEDLAGDYRERLFTLLGAVGFVLLIGCANVANLLLARGAARAREMAIRAALGAGRQRLVRQLFTESLVLGLAGGAAGAALAVLGVRALVASAPEGVPRLEQAGVDGRVLLFTLALSVACSVVFGLLPAFRAARPEIQGTLRAGGRGTTAGPRDRLRGALVTAEVALALALLTGAGLLTRSAVLLGRVDPGFDARGVLTSQLMLPAARYQDAATVVRTYERLRDEAARAPRVAQASLILMAPLRRGTAGGAISAEGQPFTEETRLPVKWQLASPGYFEMMRIALRGRDFTRRDDAAAPRVAIINEALARKLFPGQDPVGKRVSGLTGSPEDPQWTTVVGVSGDVRGAEIAKEAQPEVYFPFPQLAPGLWPLLQRAMVLAVRAAPGVADAESLERPLRAAVARVDPGLPLGEPRTMEANLRASLATTRFTMLLLGALSAIGLVLAAVGIYGIVAYFVTQRVPEIGVRMALGATPRSVLGLVVRSGLRPVLAGVVIGVAASLAASRVLRGLLYGVTPTDPLTVAGVVVLLLGATLVACLVPARRATRIDPASVMRG